MIANNNAVSMSNSVNKEKTDTKEYKLSDNKNKIDSSVNKRPAKYRNEKVVYNGIKFDSKGELNRWCELVLLQKAGRINTLARQVRICVQGKRGKTRGIYWVPDFRYFQADGQAVIEDFKSEITAKQSSFRMKVKLFKEKYPQYKILISSLEGVKEWK
jgi:hypothetical protein